MPTVIVSGVIANKARNGGAAWTRLSWALGLRRLGCDVIFVEQIAPDACVDEQGRPTPFGQSTNLRHFVRVVERFGLAGHAALLCIGGDSASQSVTEAYGIPYPEICAAASGADLLVNISGHLTLEPIRSRVRRRVFIDLDPGFTQLWHAKGGDVRLAGHDDYFTVGENVGTAACDLPTGGIRWRPVRQPVVLDEWPVVPPTTVAASERPLRLTTIANWRGPFGPVEHAGATLGSKVHEFRRFIDLPHRTGQTFELALDIHPAETRDLTLLAEHGWRVVNPKAVAGDPDRFRGYVQGSDAEFSVAQAVYVHTNTGWFSDRTVRYLASGRPAVVQETGFTRNLPASEGLLAFGTPDEAADAAQRVAANYQAHCLAARKLAETYFDSARVLGRFLDQVGIRNG
jgi:hypothetical protein